MRSQFRHLFPAFLLSLLVLSSAGFAVDNSSDNFTIPHDFSSGETISSQKMNENFNAIQENLRVTQELLNKLIKLNNLVQETKYLIVGSLGTIFISSDGTNWTSKYSGTSDSLSGVTYGNGTFVTVGYTGTILTSPDGTTWTSRSSGTSNRLYGVTYGNGTFVMVGQSGTIFTSPDGTTWTERTSGTSERLFGVTYGNGTFVVEGENGTILTSLDGTTWTERTSGTSNHLYDVYSQ